MVKITKCLVDHISVFIFIRLDYHRLDYHRIDYRRIMRIRIRISLGSDFPAFLNRIKKK